MDADHISTEAAATAGPSADWVATLVAGVLAALAAVDLLPLVRW